MADPEITDRETLRAAVENGWRPKYLFFWGHSAKGEQVGKHVLSQWWSASFEIDGQPYGSAEQYMMAEKARLFGDETIRRQILASSNPGKVKALGRGVSNFNEGVWVRHRFDIVVRGNCAKFGKNPHLADYLARTGAMVLVEASPVDQVWGIGLSADDPNASEPREWPGLNLLGFALMETRRRLLSPR
jgi:ribA/ribD-fused uncharacterized protein